MEGGILHAKNLRIKVLVSSGAGRLAIYMVGTGQRVLEAT